MEDLGAKGLSAKGLGAKGLDAEGLGVEDLGAEDLEPLPDTPSAAPRRIFSFSAAFALARTGAVRCGDALLRLVAETLALRDRVATGLEAEAFKDWTSFTRDKPADLPVGDTLAETLTLARAAGRGAALVETRLVETRLAEARFGLED